MTAPREPIAIVDYDPAWPARFEQERAAIERALAGVVGDAEIEHVGSTAVPGCAAKPVIDILVGVRSVEDALRTITPLVDLGYDCKGESGIPGRIFFRRGVPRSHHLHVVEGGGELWCRHLLFRDALRARPELVAQYTALKRELAATFRVNRIGYVEAKSPFIEGVLAQVGSP